MGPVVATVRRTMAVLEDCCCCKVRTGSLILAVLTIIGSISLIGRGGRAIVVFAGASPEDIDTLVQSEYSESSDYALRSSEDEIRLSIRLLFYFSIANFLLGILALIAASCLIHGVRNENPSLMVPALVVWPLDMFVTFIFVLIFAICLGLSTDLGFGLSFGLLWRIAIDFFIWLC